MEGINKGPDAIVRKVKKGEACKEEIAKMVEFYTSLPLNVPPQGDAASWKEKTTSLLKAAQGIQQNDPRTLESLKKLDTWRGCHTARRTGRAL